MKAIILGVAAGLALAHAAAAQEPDAAATKPIQLLTIHPPFGGAYACSEHWEGQLPYPGDALGADCYVTELVETANGGSFSRAFTGDGLKNEDWFSYGAPLLAPFDGEVVKVHVNATINEPGHLGEPPASMIVFRNADGVNALFAHVADIKVAEGDTVKAGDIVAVAGNNGYGRNPHVHIGAWNADGPMQLRHDLRARGRLNAPEEPREN